MDYQTTLIPIDKLLIDDEFNCRGDIPHGSIFQLATDIERNGLLQAVSVRPLDPKEKEEYPGKEYALVMGFRRTKACMSLQWKEIPATVRNIDKRHAKILNINENIHREDLSFWRQCLSIKDLHDMKMTRREISEAISQPMGWVQRRQNVWKMPVKAQKMVEAGILGPSHIQKLFSYEDPDELDQVLDKVREKYQNSGEEKRQIVIPKAGTTKRKRSTVARQRSKPEIENLIRYIQSAKFPSIGPWKRVLAWAAGNINDSDLIQSLKEFADELDLDFDVPDEIPEVE